MTDRFISFDNNTVNVNWDNLWANYGHRLGEGLLSPNKEHFYLKIPKNSSSFAVNHLTKLGWSHSFVKDNPHASILVALRDPMDRWISGVIEYLFMYHMNQIDHIVSNPPEFDFWPLLGERLGISLLYEKISFDDHTERQSLFLNGINLNRCQALLVDQYYSKNFSELLDTLGYPNSINNAEKINAHDAQHDSTASRKRLLREVIQFIIDRDYERKPKLLEHFEPDYQLINSIKFYRGKHV